jgi:hypothetical protein
MRENFEVWKVDELFRKIRGVEELFRNINGRKVEWLNIVNDVYTLVFVI